MDRAGGRAMGSWMTDDRAQLVSVVAILVLSVSWVVAYAATAGQWPTKRAAPAELVKLNADHARELDEIRDRMGHNVFGPFGTPGQS